MENIDLGLIKENVENSNWDILRKQLEDTVYPEVLEIIMDAITTGLIFEDTGAKHWKRDTEMAIDYYFGGLQLKELATKYGKPIPLAVVGESTTEPIGIESVRVAIKNIVFRWWFELGEHNPEKQYAQNIKQKLFRAYQPSYYQKISNKIQEGIDAQLTRKQILVTLGIELGHQTSDYRAYRTLRDQAAAVGVFFPDIPIRKEDSEEA